MSKPTDTGPNSNDGESALLAEAPFQVTFTIRGVADLLFHRWSNEDVEAKATAKRGSRIKKTDNLEAYVYRDDDGMVCLPATNLHKSIVEAGKFMQDPRSSRAKQACDLFKVACLPVTLTYPLGEKWEIEDKRRMTVNRAGITRTSPGFKAGWEASFVFDIILPEYVSQEMFHDALALAGRVIGLCQYRPTYGRFQVVKFARTLHALPRPAAPGPVGPRPARPRPVEPSRVMSCPALSSPVKPGHASPGRDAGSRSR